MINIRMGIVTTIKTIDASQGILEPDDRVLFSDIHQRLRRRKYSCKFDLVQIILHQHTSGENSKSQQPFKLTETTDHDREDQQMRRVEAVLFLSRSPLSSRKISQLADLPDGSRARALLKQLNQHYNQVGRAFHVKQVSGGFQLRTRPQFAPWLRRQEHVPKPMRLTSPALETLTVVAYRQPIIKAEIEAIRGVGCGEMLRQLLERGLIKIAGRSPELGRPFLYATTREFLTQFGLNHLNQLPRATKLAGKGLPEWVTSDENLSTLESDPNSEQEQLNDPNTDSNQDSLQKENHE